MDAVIRLDEVTKRGDSDAGPAVGGVGLHPAPGEAVAVLPAAGGRGVRVGAPPVVCVVVPTRNEAGNVGPLMARRRAGRRAQHAPPEG